MKTALVIGAGPAGLMAAETIAEAGLKVTICDAKPSFGRKFLMAGKSGLNLTKDEPTDQLVQQYFEASEALEPILRAFDAQAVQTWAKDLGQEVFIGSTGRVFPRSMKASPLLRAWLARLDELSVERHTRWLWKGWQDGLARFETPAGAQFIKSDVTVLALGGASWARLGSDGLWTQHFDGDLTPFLPSNAAVSVAWTDHMAPYFGTALKAVRWQAGSLTSRGEASLSANGLEGGGLYALTPALRQGVPLFVDLVPDHDAEKLSATLAQKPGKLRLAHWLRNTLRLPAAKVALFFEMTAGQKLDRADWVQQVKKLPVLYSGLRPIDEAISTAGGIRVSAMTPDLMLKSQLGVFCAGEMIDWEAPTGGYLITACLATGRWAGKAAVTYLDEAA